MLDERRWSEQTVDRASVHEIGSDEARECDGACDAALQGSGHGQEEEGDESNRFLNAYGVFRSREEVADFKGVLHPSEEQYDLPAPLVEVGNHDGGSIEIVGDDAQNLAALGTHAHFANGVAEWVFTASGLACRQIADAIGGDGWGP